MKYCDTKSHKRYIFINPTLPIPQSRNTNELLNQSVPFLQPNYTKDPQVRAQNKKKYKKDSYGVMESFY